MLKVCFVCFYPWAQLDLPDNKESFRQDIARVPWSVIESFEDIDDAVDAWNKLFIDVANRHAPLRNIKTNAQQSLGSQMNLKN